jgi:class 3 adenylate cyclase
MLRFGTKFVVLAVAVPLSLSAGFNPETGSPVLDHYSPDQYGASPQNWAIAQDGRGIMYFGNTSGLLEFDGLSWRTISLKNGSMAKSVGVDQNGTVFVGGQGDLGFLRPDQHGELKFVSILEKIPLEDRKFTDVWRVLPTPGGVYFSANARIFRLDRDGSIKVWRPATTFGRAIYVLGSLYVKTRELGLLKMEGDKLSPISGGSLFTKIGVSDAVSLEESALIATPAGLYQLDRTGTVQPFPTQADSWFGSNLLYTLRLLPTGQIAAGTLNGGLVLLNRNGAVDRILTKSNGLADDHVESIFADAQGGVWLAGFTGLTRFNPGLSNFPASLEGDATPMARQDGHMFVGTSAGLFRLETADRQAPRFERVAGIEYPVWTLQPRGKDLLAATDRGVFQVSGAQATRILAGPTIGTWDVSLSHREPGIIYSAGQAGVSMLRESGDAWEKAAEFAPAAQEFRTVLEGADGRVWATTRDAIWRIDFRQQPVRAEKFGTAEGVPVVPGGWISVRRLQDHVTFATSRGLRRYSESLKRFVTDETLGHEFADGSRDVFNLFEEPSGNVWVTGEKYHDLLLRHPNGYKPYPMPLESAGIKEIFWMSVDDDGTVWITGAKGVLYRWERALAGDPEKNFSVRTRLIQINQKDTLYGGAGAIEWQRLPWRDNNIHFEFAAPFYEHPAAVEYQTLLEGSDRAWSPWSHKASGDYTHLPEGSYRFQVRARSPHGAISEESTITFGVLPPWYRTWWAYTIYLICGAVVLWGAVKFRTRQLEADKRQLETIVEERTVEIREQRDEIQKQERKSHSLLLNILPASVADELKSTGAVEPVGFDDVTVCFTDFVGFTLSSEKMAPGKLVSALNEYFTAFDEIIARYGLEKLKTIGDSYMFVSGLPTQRKSHAVDAVLAALEMVQVVKDLAGKADGTGWNIRVGLHSGPVVAGVVGIRKFAFDIWGNTVNFAARMESSGVPGRVNMSERTCRLTRGLIDCEARGKVKIKEGRELPMFLAAGPARELGGRLKDGIPVAFSARYAEEFSESPRSFPEFMPETPAEHQEVVVSTGGAAG